MNLYSPNAAERYAASLAHQEQPDFLWPRACWGAANAFLMLVGPSPGAPDPGQAQWAGGPGRPLDEKPTIGPASGLIKFDANPARNNRWNNLCASGIQGNSAHAQALTAVANLDWGHNSNQNQIPDQYLWDGADIVFDVMKQAKPRIMIALTQRVWSVLSQYIPDHAVDMGYQPITKLDSMALQIPQIVAPTLLLRTPQHPSRHFFAPSHMDKIKEETSNFLA